MAAFLALVLLAIDQVGSVIPPGTFIRLTPACICAQEYSQASMVQSSATSVRETAAFSKMIETWSSGAGRVWYQFGTSC